MQNILQAWFSQQLNKKNHYKVLIKKNFGCIGKWCIIPVFKKSAFHSLAGTNRIWSLFITQIDAITQRRFLSDPKLAYFRMELMLKLINHTRHAKKKFY